MRPHYIKPNESTETPTRLLFYDTETHPHKMKNATLHTLKLGVTRYIQLRRNKIEKDEWYTFTKPEEFWRIITEKTQKKKALWVISHNQHFDFNVVQGFPSLLANGYRIRKMVIDPDMFLIKAKNEKGTVVFIDTLNYVKTSLAQLGETIRLPKLPIDFEKATEDELLRYCKRDVEILSQWFINLLQFWHRNQLGKFGFTISQLAFNNFRHIHLTTKILSHHDPTLTTIEIESYRGGRNECFFIGHLKGKFYKLDVNSMYPFVMATNQYPTKYIKTLTNPDPETLKDLIQHYDIIATVKLNTPEPFVGVKREKLIFPVGQFWVTVNTPELQYALKKNYVKETKIAVLYKRAMIFKSYVEYWYKLKQEAEKKGNQVERQFAKLMLNSLYGKFGQRTRDYIPLDIIPPTQWGSFTLLDTTTHQRSKVIVIDGQPYLLSRNQKLFADANIAIAATVTAHARMHLWYYIQQARIENVYYTDTDSLFVNQTGYENLKPYIGDDLGLLKLEKTADELEIRGPKDYTFGTETKIKGIKNTDTQINQNTYITTRLYKTKTLLTKGITQGPIEHTQTKTLTRNYDKGQIQPDGRIKPITLNEP